MIKESTMYALVKVKGKFGRKFETIEKFEGNMRNTGGYLDGNLKESEEK